MRRFLPLLFLLACGTKHPPENAQRMAMPGEPCYAHPHPWDDPPAGGNWNTSNLPQCVPDRWKNMRFDTLGDRFLFDAGAD